jgi:hypothetical protein
MFFRSVVGSLVNRPRAIELALAGGEHTAPRTEAVKLVVA